MISVRNITNKSQKGFTLIELLVVIGILAILLSIVLVAINPARQFGQANDTKRRSDATAILNAIGQYESDNKGSLPPTMAAMTTDGTAYKIASGVGNVDLCTDLVKNVSYISALPTDPTGPQAGAPVTTCTSYDSGYTLALDTNKRVTIYADLTQIASPTISIQR